MGKVERLNSQPVAAEHQAFSGFAPDRECEHAPQSRKTLQVPFKEGPEHDLGVAAGAKPVAQTRKFVSHLLMVIDFTVANDDSVPIIAKDRLSTPPPVDNLQPAYTQF